MLIIWIFRLLREKEEKKKDRKVTSPRKSYQWLFLATCLKLYETSKLLNFELANHCSLRYRRFCFFKCRFGAKRQHAIPRDRKNERLRKLPPSVFRNVI